MYCLHLLIGQVGPSLGSKTMYTVLYLCFLFIVSFVFSLGMKVYTVIAESPHS